MESVRVNSDLIAIAAIAAIGLPSAGPPDVPFVRLSTGPGDDNTALQVKNGVAAADTRGIAAEERRATVWAARIVIIDKALAMSIDGLFLPAFNR